MEADAYERISSALTSRLRQTNLPIRSPCGIDRIVWSVWDYIVGPELRFVWDVVPSELDQLTAPVADSDSDAASTNSAVTTTERSVSGRSQESGGEFISHYHENSLDPVLGDGNNQFDASELIVAEIHACGRCLKGGCRGGDDCVISNVAEVVGRALKLADSSDEQKMHKPVESPQMSNSTSSPGDPLQSSQSTLVDSETSDSFVDQSNVPLANLKVSLIASTSSSSHQSQGCHEDGSAGMFLSQHTDVSVDDVPPAACSSPLQNSVSSLNDSRSIGGTAEEGMEARSMASTVENGTTHEMSDEQYVAVHTLSSEVYRAHYSDDVEFKLINVPERRMTTAAYIFAAKHRDQPKAVHSLAFVMKDRRLPWFMSVKEFCTLYMDDLIPKLKAAFFVESFDEVLTRMTTELTQILSVLGDLETRSFTAWAFQISDTFLSKPKLADNDFLRFCISSHLQSQGRTVVVGSDIRNVNRMLRTLGLFMPMKDRVFCLHAGGYEEEALASVRRKVLTQQSRYCPYLKLQGFPKTEVHFILQRLVYSPWPVCLIDVDLETVAQSLPWRRHSEMRRNALKHDLNQILLGRSQRVKEQSKRLLSEMKTGDLSETLVKRFLQQVDVLPYDNRIRDGFVRQFMRHLAHKAAALEVFLRDATDDGADRSGLRISRLRRGLDLESDGNFMIVLAIADQIRPGLMEFLMKRDASA